VSKSFFSNLNVLILEWCQVCGGSEQADFSAIGLLHLVWCSASALQYNDKPIAAGSERMTDSGRVLRELSICAEQLRITGCGIKGSNLKGTALELDSPLDHKRAIAITNLRAPQVDDLNMGFSIFVPVLTDFYAAKLKNVEIWKHAET
jgi:hypothetical protein